MNYSWKRGKQTGFLLFALPALVLFSVLYVYPMIGGVYYSFTDWDGLKKKFNVVGLANYIKAFSDSRVLASMGFTVRYTILLVASVLSLALFLALIVTYALHPKTKTFFRSIFFAPVVLSLITVGLIFNEIFYRIFPALGHMIGSELFSKNILGNPKTVIYGILSVNIWQGVGIPFAMILAGLQNVPADLYEAATIDGANPVQMFRRITIPFLLPVLNVCFVLTFKNGLTVFEYIQAMTEGGPARSSEAVGFLIYKLAFWEYKMSYSLVISVGLLIVISAVSILQIRISSRYEAGQL